MANSSFPTYKNEYEMNSPGIIPQNDSTKFELRYSPAATAVIIVFMSVLTLIVILGNAMIIISVLQVSKLRHNKSNFLLASLAVCDMMVGFVVMPIAILPEVLVAWPLGKEACLMWVTFDVTLCTASILHLMMIAIDRYCIISSVRYEMRIRSTKVIFGYISVAWAVSALISLTPAMVGWLPDYGPEGKGCKVNQEIEYQMYATFVAFYMPLAVKLSLYGRLYFLSRRLVRAEAKNLPQVDFSETSSGKTSTPSHHSSSNSSPMNVSRNGNERQQPKDMVAVAECLPLNSALSVNVDHRIVDNADTKSLATEEGEWLPNNENLNNNAHLSVYGSQLSCAEHEGSRRPSRIKGARSFLKRKSLAAAHRISHLFHSESHHKHRSNMAAIRTLGAIMGLFTICWLPFFVLAVVSPLCGDHCDIPSEVYSVFLWIGYANSCFNPFIYAQFNTEFREPFKEILRCHCSTVDTAVRHSDYISRYGAENER